MGDSNLENTELDINEKNLLLFLTELYKLLKKDEEDEDGDSSWTIFDLDKLIKKYRLMGIDVTNLVDALKNSKLLKEDIPVEKISALLGLRLDNIKLSEFIDDIKLKNSNLENSIINNGLKSGIESSIDSDKNSIKPTLSARLANIVEKAKKLKAVITKVAAVCLAVAKTVKQSIDSVKKNISKIADVIKTKAKKEEVEISNASKSESAKKTDKESSIGKQNDPIDKDNNKAVNEDTDKNPKPEKDNNKAVNEDTDKNPKPEKDNTKDKKPENDTKEKAGKIKDEKNNIKEEENGLDKQKDSLKDKIENNKKLDNPGKVEENKVDDNKKEKSETEKIVENFPGLKGIGTEENPAVSVDNSVDEEYNDEHDEFSIDKDSNFENYKNEITSSDEPESQQQNHIYKEEQRNSQSKSKSSGINRY